MAKPRKKTAAPEPPPMPQVGDKVYPPRSEMVYEISKVHYGGNEVDLHVPGVETTPPPQAPRKRRAGPRQLQSHARDRVHTLCEIRSRLHPRNGGEPVLRR